MLNIEPVEGRNREAAIGCSPQVITMYYKLEGAFQNWRHVGFALVSVLSLRAGYWERSMGTLAAVVTSTQLNNTSRVATLPYRCFSKFFPSISSLTIEIYSWGSVLGCARVFIYRTPCTYANITRTTIRNQIELVYEWPC